MSAEERSLPSSSWILLMSIIRQLLPVPVTKYNDTLKEHLWPTARTNTSVSGLLITTSSWSCEACFAWSNMRVSASSWSFWSSGTSLVSNSPSAPTRKRWHCLPCVKNSSMDPNRSQIFFTSAKYLEIQKRYFRYTNNQAMFHRILYVFFPWYVLTLTKHTLTTTIGLI